MKGSAVSFVHLTDLHVSVAKDGEAGSGLATLDAVLATVKAIVPAPAFVVVSGDLTDRGDAESYQAVSQRMAALGLPVVYALGNHDSREGFLRGVPGRGTDPQVPYCHEETIAGVHVVTLDTSVPGRTSGQIGDVQLAFLDAALERQPDLPKIVVMHHAPRIDEASPHAWESLDAVETARLLGIVRDRNVAGILTGHIHHDRFSSWYGIPLVVGTGLSSYIDPLYREGLRVLSGGSFALCTLRDWGLSVSVIPLASDQRELATIDAATVATFK